MRITPATAGFIVGFLAAALQAFFHVIPPPAYGICIACHMRDLVNWFLNMPRAPVSQNIPVLTTTGVILGAAFSAILNGEFRWKTMKVKWQRPWAEFFLGMGVMIFALLMGGCPIRTALKVAYLDLTALFGLFMIFAGVSVACFILKKIS